MFTTQCRFGFSRGVHGLGWALLLLIGLGGGYPPRVCAQPDAVANPATTAPPNSTAFTFIVLDNTLFLKKPQLAQYGIKPTFGIDRGIFQSRGPRPQDEDPNEPDEKKIRYLARAIARHKTTLFYLDIEDWPLTGDARTVQQSIDKFVHIADWLHHEEPGLRFGFYGILPRRDFWRAVRGPADSEYQAWQAENRRLREIARHVDVLFPSLYTFYDDPASWEQYATANLLEARQYYKQVYPFIWMQYHDSNKKLAGKYLPGPFWERELETCYKYADGLVLWGGGGDWDNNAPWWQVTLKFLRAHGIAPPAKDER